MSNTEPFACFSLPTEDCMRQIAQTVAPRLEAGDTLLLSGEIGTGKSFFCRAVIQSRLAALDRIEDVPSPTFTLVQVYDLEDCDLWHCDLYRLTTPEDCRDLGLEDAFDTAICLVEWPDRLGPYAPEDALWVALEIIGDTARRLTFSAAPNSAWSDRLSDLGSVVA